MKKTLRRLGLLLTFLALSACGGPSILEATPMRSGAIPSDGNGVGVMMTKIPKLGSERYANCVSCTFKFTGVSSTLRDHMEQLALDDLSDMSTRIADTLKSDGKNVRVIDDPLIVETLKAFPGSAQSYAAKDYRALRKTYGVDKLIVVNYNALGFYRPERRSRFHRLNDPRAFLVAQAYLIDLRSNEIQWYLPIDDERQADGEWRELPDYPNLTTTLYQMIGQANQKIIDELTLKSRR